MHKDPIIKLEDTEIPTVEQHKFLGIILDKKLSFIPHIKKLRIKCNKAIQLLRVVAHTEWGADKKTLLKLYRTLVRAKLDYGCFIYRSARKSYLRELDTIHHQGLRLALGAYNTSPVESLYIEANEPPLELRRQKLALQYYTKLSSCPTNPTYNNTFHPQYTELFDQKEKAIKPYSLRMKGILLENEMDTTQVHKSIISTTPPWLIEQPKVILDLARYPKTKTNPTIYQEEITIIKNNHPDHLYIYTDGSKNKSKVGCAAILNNTKQSKRLTNKASIYSAEITAIDLALDIITANKHNKFIIFTDSMSVLTALKNKKTVDPLTIKVLNRIHRISKENKNIILCWIPSHIGIQGNDKADSEAKKAINKLDVVQMRLSQMGIDQMNGHQNMH